jgi:hypothetical protein
MEPISPSRVTFPATASNANDAVVDKTTASSLRCNETGSGAEYSSRGSMEICYPSISQLRRRCVKHPWDGALSLQPRAVGKWVLALRCGFTACFLLFRSVSSAETILGKELSENETEMRRWKGSQWTSLML